MYTRVETEEIQNLIKTVKELKQNLENVIRPADEVIYDDIEFRNLLKVSKRTAAYWRERGIITFSKLGGKIYYRLSDILTLLKRYEVPAVASNLKIAL
jgi:Helix-turn-helix domain